MKMSAGHALGLVVYIVCEGPGLGLAPGAERGMRTSQRERERPVGGKPEPIDRGGPPLSRSSFMASLLFFCGGPTGFITRRARVTYATDWPGNLIPFRSEIELILLAPSQVAASPICVCSPKKRTTIHRKICPFIYLHVRPSSCIGRPPPPPTASSIQLEASRETGPEPILMIGP